MGQGGAGGGAIKLIAEENLTIGGRIEADGGRGGAYGTGAYHSGAGGSGGAIYLKAKKITLEDGAHSGRYGKAGGKPVRRRIDHSRA